MKKLSGKTALVTGGSRGIGAATARALAAAGADVAISYVASPEKANALVQELEKSGVRAVAFKANQANETEVAGLVKAAHKHFGRLDILVTNAGVFVTGDVTNPENNIDELNRQYSVNVGGVITAIRTAAPLLSEGGRIISIGSVIGERAGLNGVADYALTKAAIVGYTRGAARDFGKRKITVNVVQPGPIDTDMNPANSDFASVLTPGLALGRYGKPEEIAAGVAFLASPEASYITGTVLNIDGGANA